MTSRIKTLVPLAIFIFLGTDAFASAPIQDLYQKLKNKSQSKSSELLIAEHESHQKSAALYTAWTRWAPRVDLELDQSRYKDYSLVNSGSLGALGSTITVTSKNQAKWSLVASMPIYRRSVHLGVEQAIYENRLSKVTNSIKLQEVDWKLRRSLGQYLLQLYKLATIKNSIEIAKTNKKEAELRFDLGQKTKIDVLRARTNLLTLESQETQFIDQKKRAYHDLMELSGLTQEDFGEIGFETFQNNQTEESLGQSLDQFTQFEIEYKQMTPYLGESENTVPQALQEQAVKSPLYQNFITQEKLGISRAHNIMADVWPDLSLRGAINKQGDTWSKATESGNRSSSVAVVLNIPIFSSGSTISTWMEKSELQNLTGAKSTRDMVQFMNQIEIERSQILSQKSMLEATQTKVSQNEEIYRLSFKSYQLGKSTMVELLSAQNDFIQSKIELAQSKLDLSTGLRQLAWQLGIGIQNEN